MDTDAVATLAEQGAVPAIPGVSLATVAAGLRYQGRDDLAVIALPPEATVAAIFTTNRFCAAPVTVAKAHLRSGNIRYLLINAGNANAGTGDRGITDAFRSCQVLAEAMGCQPEQVLPFSTGVIGEYLPMAALEQGLARLLPTLGENQAWHGAARAIMTTDSYPKLAARVINTGEHQVTITGMAKGAGMICPDMATMLAFVGIDAQIPAPVLQQLLKEVAAVSFNRITVDGDTSTNDACVLFATGVPGGCIVDGSDTALLDQVRGALAGVCTDLAQAIIRDAEGATKFVTLRIEQAANPQEALSVAYSIAHSPLVKTAFFASDPNWGRILAAIGRSGIADLDVSRLSLYLDDVCVVAGGARAPGYQETQGQSVMDRQDITLRVLLGRGSIRETVWTSDLSHDYVRINAEYRS